MEKLLDYIVYALLGHTYSVAKCSRSPYTNLLQWSVRFEDSVVLIFDENDVKVFRFMAETSEDPDTKVRISKLLTYFV